MKAALSMTVLDDGSMRSDLSQRLESKYVFRTHDVGMLRHALLRFCRPIIYADRVSQVRSIYFDDPTLSTARANLDGIGERRKSRIRWYDAPEPSEQFFLESKWREYRVTGKHRLHLESAAQPAAMAYRELREAMLFAAPEHAAAVGLIQYTDPVAMVEYKREHFELLGTSARLTLDYDMRFVPQLGRLRLNHRFAERLPGVALIEFKSGADDQRHAARVLAPLNARHTRFSKYVAACQRLGYISAG